MKLGCLLRPSAIVILIMISSCAEEPQGSNRQEGKTSLEKTSVLNSQDGIYLKDKQENTIRVIGAGRVENKKIKFVCNTAESCEIPNKLFDNDVDVVETTDTEFIGGTILDLEDMSLQNISNLKRFTLIKRKNKIVVTVRFRNKAFPAEVTVEPPTDGSVGPVDAPKGGSVQLDASPPCSGTCSSYMLPFDDFADLNAIPAEDWEVEKWTIGETVLAAQAVPNLKKIIVKQTKNGLKIKIKFRKKRMINLVANSSECRVGPLLPLSLSAPKDVCTPADLAAMAPTGHYRLVCDVDLAGVNWTPLAKFSGRFDGNNHVIKNLHLTQSIADTDMTGERLAGFFSSVSGSVYNVAFSNATVLVSDSDRTGLIAGTLANGAQIKNIIFSGSIESTNRGFIGGIAGTIKDDVSIEKICANTAVTLNGPHARDSAAGGIIGFVDMTRDSSSSLDSISFKGSVIAPAWPLHSAQYSYSTALKTYGVAGGIVGYSPRYAIIIKNIAFDGRAAGTEVGGILGVGAALISDSQVAGTILIAATERNDAFAGGVAGLFGVLLTKTFLPAGAKGGKIERVKSSIDIIGPVSSFGGENLGGAFVGGLVGELSANNGQNGINSTITDSYSEGLIKIDMNKIILGVGALDVGGLVGWVSYCTTNTLISNSYSVSSIDAPKPSSFVSFYNVGGLIGAGEKTENCYKNSYWNVKASGVSSSAGGTGLTTTEMTQQSYFNGWDFTNTWKLGSGYPTLRSTP